MRGRKTICCDDSRDNGRFPAATSPLFNKRCIESGSVTATFTSDHSSAVFTTCDIHAAAVKGTRSNQVTSALLRPFTYMKSRIKASTNHSTVFQLPLHIITPLSSSQNATAWRSWQPFIACCLGLSVGDLSLSVASQDNTDRHARIWLHARLHHEVLAHVLYSTLVVQFVSIVETVILTVVLEKDHSMTGWEKDRGGLMLKNKERKKARDHFFLWWLSLNLTDLFPTGSSH